MLVRAGLELLPYIVDHGSSADLMWADALAFRGLTSVRSTILYQKRARVSRGDRETEQSAQLPLIPCQQARSCTFQLRAVKTNGSTATLAGVEGLAQAVANKVEG